MENLNEKKQIEEMAKDICDYARGEICILDDKKCNMQCTSAKIAKKLTAKGYRKQSEGEWISNRQAGEYICNLCGGIAPVDCEKEDFYKSNYCPYCGAKMKGGAE